MHAFLSCSNERRGKLIVGICELVILISAGGFTCQKQIMPKFCRGGIRLENSFVRSLQISCKFEVRIYYWALSGSIDINFSFWG